MELYVFFNFCNKIIFIIIKKLTLLYIPWIIYMRYGTKSAMTADGYSLLATTD